MKMIRLFAPLLYKFFLGKLEKRIYDIAKCPTTHLHGHTGWDHINASYTDDNNSRRESQIKVYKSSFEVYGCNSVEIGPILYYMLADMSDRKNAKRTKEEQLETKAKVAEVLGIFTKDSK